MAEGGRGPRNYFRPYSLFPKRLSMTRLVTSVPSSPLVPLAHFNGDPWSSEGRFLLFSSTGLISADDICSTCFERMSSSLLGNLFPLHLRTSRCQRFQPTALRRISSGELESFPPDFACVWETSRRVADDSEHAVPNIFTYD